MNAEPVVNGDDGILRPARVEAVEVDLPGVGQPFSWATRAISTGIVFTASGPVRPDGTIDTGPIEQQTRLTLENLRKVVHASGATMSDVAQVLIYMTEAEYMPTIDRVYKEFFTAPFPNRSSMVVKALVVPGMAIELVAYIATR